MHLCQVRSLGLVPYQQAWDMQNQLAAQISEGTLPPTLLLLEHPHTYTFGRGGKSANLLWSQEELDQKGVQVFWVDRGGDVTYHGPGQLVGYPLIPLDLPGQEPAAGTDPLPRGDYIAYLRKLEQVVIQALAEFGIQGERLKNLTGVWVKGEKIAAIGVKVDARGITRHGFALNVAPAMHYWDGIIACGIADHSVTSLALQLADPPSVEQVIPAIISAFEAVFGYECRSIS